MTVFTGSVTAKYIFHIAQVGRPMMSKSDDKIDISGTYKYMDILSFDIYLNTKIGRDR